MAFSGKHLDLNRIQMTFLEKFSTHFRVLLPCHANHTIFKFKRLCKKMFKTALISAKFYHIFPEKFVITCRTLLLNHILITNRATLSHNLIGRQHIKSLNSDFINMSSIFFYSGFVLRIPFCQCFYIA